jgi:hypothetical protein
VLSWVSRYGTFDQFMLRHDNDKHAAESGVRAFARERISHTLQPRLSQNKTHFARTALRETKLADVSR